MDRLRQGTPAISAYYHTVRGLYFTLELAAAPMGSAPMLRVRKPDNMPVLGEDFVLLVYKARQRTTCRAPFVAFAGGPADFLTAAYLGGALLVSLAIGLAMLIAVRWAWFSNGKEEVHEGYAMLESHLQRAHSRRRGEKPMEVKSKVV